MHAGQGELLPAFPMTRKNRPDRLGSQVYSLLGEGYIIGEVRVAGAAWWYLCDSMINTATKTLVFDAGLTSKE